MARHGARHSARHSARQSEPPDRHHESGLHPLLYRAIVGFAAWLALSAWGFSGTSPYTTVILVVVTGFVLVSVAIPSLLWRIWRSDHRRSQPGQDDASRESLHDWLLGELDIWQTHLKGADAAVATLLPLAAVAVGMTIFAIVKHFAAAGAF